MPYVNVKITKEDTTKEQKQEIVSGITVLLERILGKNPKTTFVIIEEIDCDNWGIEGRLVSDIRRCKS
jgi:4-oxalocrotonate tautomerase